MEQEMSLQFTRLAASLVITASVLVVLIGVLFVRYRRLIRQWRAVGFTFRAGRTLLVRITPVVLIIAMLGVAFAEPVLVSEDTIFERNDAEVGYLFDNAGSAAASRASGEPQRIERALSIAQKLSESEAMFGVKTFIATFTSTPTLHLPTTSHMATIMSVLQDVITVGDPPPETRCMAGETCTDIRALEDVALRFFSGENADTERILIVFTDGETSDGKTNNEEKEPLSSNAMTKKLEDAGVKVIFVDLWSSNEAIFDGQKCVDTSIGCIDMRYSGDIQGREAFLAFVQDSGSGYVTEANQSLLAGMVSDMLGEPDPATDNSPIATSEARTPYSWLFVLIAGLLLMVTYSEHITDSITALKPKRRGPRR